MGALCRENRPIFARVSDEQIITVYRNYFIVYARSSKMHPFWEITSRPKTKPFSKGGGGARVPLVPPPLRPTPLDHQIIDFVFIFFSVPLLAM